MGKNIIKEIEKLEPFIGILDKREHVFNPPEGIAYPESGPDDEVIPVSEDIFSGNPPDFDSEDEPPFIGEEDSAFLEDLISIFSGELDPFGDENENGAGYGQASVTDPLSKNRPVNSITPAWYQPIHFFGYNWGIFIRLDCLEYQAKRIAFEFMRLNQNIIRKHGAHMVALKALKLFRKASFYCYYLHECYHHKVESLGFRLHVTTGPSYVSYKKNVYRPSYLTPNCLEESLANASSFLRINDKTYKDRLGPEITEATRSYLEKSFHKASPGYREATLYLSKAKFLTAERRLQSQIKDGSPNPPTNPDFWNVAKGMMTGICNIKSHMYQIVSPNRKPVLPQPLFHLTISHNQMVKAAQMRGYEIKKNEGKGSHTKMVNHHLTGRERVITIPRQKSLSNLKYSIAKSIGFGSRQDMEYISSL